MTEIQVAHLRMQGTDFVFVPLSSAMARLQVVDQTSVLNELRTLSKSAGLSGEVVPVWQGSTGAAYVADPRHHAILSKSLRLDLIKSHLNKQLSATGASSTLVQLVHETRSTPTAAEMAIVDGLPRSARVRTLKNCIALSLKSARLNSSPEIAVEIFRNIAAIQSKRLRKMNQTEAV